MFVRWVGALVTLVLVAGEANAAGDLKIYHFDVGHVDATLVIAPSGKTLLIDGGDQGWGEDVVVPRLGQLGVNYLDYVIATHFDADHIGGLDEILQAVRFAPDGVLDHGNKGPLEEEKRVTDLGNPRRYGEYAEAANLSKTRDSIALGRGVIDLGAGVIVTVVAANGCALGFGREQYRKRLDKNGTSVALVISHGTFDYFIGGDLTGGGRSGAKRTEDLETSVAASVGHVDALRLSHHGSNTSSNRAFLETLRPTSAVISVGDGGRNKGYFLPNTHVLDRLHDIKPLSLKAVFVTNKGETKGGLSHEDRELLQIVERDVVIRSFGDRFTINGERYRTDGAISPAAAATVPLTETCVSKREGPPDA